MNKLVIKGKALAKVPVEYEFEMSMMAEDGVVVEEAIMAYLRQRLFPQAEVDSFTIPSVTIKHGTIQQYIRDESDDSELLDFKISFQDT